MPVLVSGGMLIESAVGQLQYANRIVTTPYSLLVAGISYVIFPAFARIATTACASARPPTDPCDGPSLVAMPIGLILAPLGEPLAIVVFGERWSLAGEVTAAISLFIPAQTIAAEIGEGFKGSRHPGQADPRERDRGHCRGDHDARSHTAAGPVRRRRRHLGRRHRRRDGGDRARQPGDGDPSAIDSSSRSRRPRRPPC